jgi:hypothetical protein
MKREELLIPQDNCRFIFILSQGMMNEKRRTVDEMSQLPAADDSCAQAPRFARFQPESSARTTRHGP